MKRSSPAKPFRGRGMLGLLAVLVLSGRLPAGEPAPLGVTASSTAERSAPAGAADGRRFDLSASTYWQGEPGETSWWWEIRFAAPRRVGAILQIVGDHPRNFRNAPSRYAWQCSDDGRTWRDLEETRQTNDRRLFRLHRLSEPVAARYLRLRIDACQGDRPTVREVELFDDLGADVAFPDWCLSVKTTEDPTLDEGKTDFVRLLDELPDWRHLAVQEIWLGDVNEAFAAAEPRPLCAFLSGNFLPWCKRTREPWRGLQEVLRRRNLPTWAACGGAQGLLILDTVGVDSPWDCPFCRDLANPRIPVYNEIGHKEIGACGEFDKCIAERGIYKMRKTADDPAFAGLPEVFDAPESHVGQMAFVPDAWVRVVEGGPGALTKNQCLRVRDRYIYAAQFHIELPGAPENSRRIASNFLRLAKQYGGYNPEAPPVAPPPPAARQSADTP
ncbi:MAG: discoidin domain-containing protein [Pirellulales bacterium]|nr:discoidin domain-containing protein [Pirellulales bacterium]